MLDSTSDFNQDHFGSTAPLVNPEELPSWFIHEDESLLVINKPGWLVCHPSKNGPYSSLVGAVREYLKIDTLHLVSRLDRETSGLILIAKDSVTARKYQVAIQNRKVKKTYIALLEGEFSETITVNKALIQSEEDLVHIKVKVTEDAMNAQPCESLFQPIIAQNDYTLCAVHPKTGRKHQIRAHAEWLNHRVVGDKIYGPDQTLFLDFIDHGWIQRHQEALPIRRQALHCYRYSFDFLDGEITWTAPLQEDLYAFCKKYMSLPRVVVDEGITKTLA